VAVGSQVNMTLVFSNLGGPGRMGWLTEAGDYTLTGTLRFFGVDGSPLEVVVNGTAASEFPFALEASSVSYLEVSAPAGVDLERGWLLVELDEDQEDGWGYMDGHAVVRGERLMASAYYSIFSTTGELVSQVAVQPMTFRRGLFARSLVAAQYRQGPGGVLRTGVAIVNTGGEGALVDLKLIDADGQVAVTAALNLAAGAQIAQFVDELFPAIPADFRGVLELSTTAEGVVSMGLLQTGLVTTSLPVHHYGTWTQTQ
jgi:hypothetical protein